MLILDMILISGGYQTCWVLDIFNGKHLSNGDRWKDVVEQVRFVGYLPITHSFVYSYRLIEIPCPPKIYSSPPVGLPCLDLRVLPVFDPPWVCLFRYSRESSGVDSCHLLGAVRLGFLVMWRDLVSGASDLCKGSTTTTASAGRWSLEARARRR